MKRLALILSILAMVELAQAGPLMPPSILPYYTSYSAPIYNGPGGGTQYMSPSWMNSQYSNAQWSPNLGMNYAQPLPSILSPRFGQFQAPFFNPQIRPYGGPNLGYSQWNGYPPPQAQSSSPLAALLAGLLPMLLKEAATSSQDRVEVKPKSPRVAPDTVEETADADPLDDTVAQAPVVRNCTSCRANLHTAPVSRIDVAQASIPQVGQTVQRPAPASTDRVASVDDVEAPTPLPPRKPVQNVIPQVGQKVNPPREIAKPTRSSVLNIQPQDQDERRALSAPIWQSFITKFSQCAPGCRPIQYSSYGSRGHASCHPSGKALDVFGMVCGGQRYMAINQGKYAEMVQCMKGKMKVLYRNKDPNQVGITEAHYNHAHFSDGCMIDGHKYW